MYKSTSRTWLGLPGCRKNMCISVSGDHAKNMDWTTSRWRKKKKREKWLVALAHGVMGPPRIQCCRFCSYLPPSLPWPYLHLRPHIVLWYSLFSVPFSSLIRLHSHLITCPILINIAPKPFSLRSHSSFFFYLFPSFVTTQQPLKAWHFYLILIEPLREHSEWVSEWVNEYDGGGGSGWSLCGTCTSISPCSSHIRRCQPHCCPSL